LHPLLDVAAAELCDRKAVTKRDYGSAISHNISRFEYCVCLLRERFPQPEASQEAGIGAVINAYWAVDSGEWTRLHAAPI